MSIITDMERLAVAKADLKSAIEAKGVTVASSTKLDGYAALVELISGSAANSKLPLGYTQYDYIEGDGTDGLVTQVTGPCIWSMNFQSTDSGAKQFLGCSSTWRNYALRTSSNYWGYSTDSGYYISGLGTNPKLHVVVTFLARTFMFYANGSVIYKTATSDVSYSAPWCILKLSSLPEAVRMAAKLWSADCWQGGNLVFHGIPCKRNSDNAAGLYDTVSETFITANGFTAGNDA